MMLLMLVILHAMVIKLSDFSSPYTIHEELNIDGQVIYSGGIIC